MDIRILKERRHRKLQFLKAAGRWEGGSFVCICVHHTYTHKCAHTHGGKAKRCDIVWCLSEKQIGSAGKLAHVDVVGVLDDVLFPWRKILHRDGAAGRWVENGSICLIWSISIRRPFENSWRHVMHFLSFIFLEFTLKIFHRGKLSRRLLPRTHTHSHTFADFEKLGSFLMAFKGRGRWGRGEHVKKEQICNRTASDEDVRIGTAAEEK